MSLWTGIPLIKLNNVAFTYPLLLDWLYVSLNDNLWKRLHNANLITESDPC
jgi:hypothetical protein